MLTNILFCSWETGKATSFCIGFGSKGSQPRTSVAFRPLILFRISKFVSKFLLSAQLDRCSFQSVLFSESNKKYRKVFSFIILNFITLISLFAPSSL